MTDPKVEAARIEVERSRAQMLDTVKVLQQRLQPGKLTRDAWESAKMKGADLAEDVVDAVRKRPYAAGGVVAALALFIARDPVMGLFSKASDAMTSKRARKAPAKPAAKRPRTPRKSATAK